MPAAVRMSMHSHRCARFHSSITVVKSLYPSLQDICSLPAETGNCRAAIPRYAYDPKIGKCKLFSYGGCGGNANNFETVKECEAACAPTPTVRTRC